MSKLRFNHLIHLKKLRRQQKAKIMIREQKKARSIHKNKKNNQFHNGLANFIDEEILPTIIKKHTSTSNIKHEDFALT